MVALSSLNRRRRFFGILFSKQKKPALGGFLKEKLLRAIDRVPTQAKTINLAVQRARPIKIQTKAA